ncbi:nitroreductase family protein, partial [Candidatus Woesearchaeota archaeon]|nr:nitroreductase family protein [Candidatus Woesearchaeota archaeon]
PSPKNLQAWHFVVIKNKKLISKIMNTRLAARPEGPTMIENKDPSEPKQNLPSLLILVFLDRQKSVFFDPRYHGNTDKTDYAGVDEFSYSDIVSLGCVLQNMSLAAQESGIGSCITGDILEEGINPEIYDLVGVDKQMYEIITAIRLGYPLNPDEKSWAKKNELNEHIKIIE